jgi:hypothetical protein
MSRGYVKVGFAGNLGKGYPMIVISADDAQEGNGAMEALGPLSQRKALLFRSLS